MNKKSTPTQLRAIQTKNSIQNVAFKLFLKNGYKKTNTSLIAKNSKVSIGIVYSYFNDKDELLELWLNNLLERFDDYLYNQLKLRQYGVELTMIMTNVLEKTSELFFSSPIIEERDNLRLKKMLNNFFDKIKKIFTKCCFESMINIRHQMETTQTILSLFLAYNSELKQSSNLNINTLKQCYSKAICSLLDY